MIVSRASRLPHVMLFLAALDIAAVAGSLLFAILLRFGWGDSAAYIGAHRGTLALVWASYPIVFYILGLYEAARLQRVRRIFSSAALSVASATLLIVTSFYMAFSLAIGRGVIFTFALVVFLTVSILRLLYREAMHLGLLGQRCLVIGTGDMARRAIELVRTHRSAGLTIMGIVECGSRRAHSRVGQLDVLGTLEDLDAIVEESGIDRLILAGSPEDEPAIIRSVRALRYRGIGLVDYVSLHEELAQEVLLDDVNDAWLFTAATTNSQFHVRRLKRLMDVVISGIVMIPVGLFVLPFAALCIKLTSSGPVLFRQERVGLEGRPFKLLKLRTMRDDAEKLTGPVWSTENDPRITSIGRFLRKFRIDELPQLINVLCGDMSLIGPRPERDIFVRKLAQTLPHYEERLMVRPGITGWAQVMAPYAASVEDTRIKLQFDLFYIKHMSLFLDVVIMAKTVKTMLFGREREQGGIVTCTNPSSPLAATAAQDSTRPIVRKAG